MDLQQILTDCCFTLILYVTLSLDSFEPSEITVSKENSIVDFVSNLWITCLGEVIHNSLTIVDNSFWTRMVHQVIHSKMEIVDNFLKLWITFSL